MTHLLDNPVWNALTSGNKNLATGNGQDLFYPPEVAPFAALEQNSHEALRRLYNSTPAESSTFAVVATEEMERTDPWKAADKVNVLQLVWETPTERKTATETLVDLGEQHISQMLELTALTKPGPFRQRTIEFGHYQGIFDGQRLVAMAGQRMHAIPYAEISAVCTHPDYNGRGYAAQLVQAQVNRISKAGEIPFLHTAATNEGAIRLYHSLGFVTRKELLIYVLTK